MNKEKLYNAINNNGLNHKDTIKASEELDQEVLRVMLKDPMVENIYLKQVIKSKEHQIKNLQRRIVDLSQLAQMKYESGTPFTESINIVVDIAKNEGSI